MTEGGQNRRKSHRRKSCGRKSCGRALPVALALVCLGAAGGSLFLPLPAIAQPVPGETGSSELAVSTEIRPGGRRVFFDWAEPVTFDANLVNNVLVVRFGRPFTAELRDLERALKDSVSVLRADPDRRTLRMALRGRYRVETGRNGRRTVIDIVDAAYEGPQPPIPPLADDPAAESGGRIPAPDFSRVRPRPKPESLRPPPPPPPPPPAPQDVTLRIGQEPSFSRLAFIWEEAVSYGAAETATGVRLTFDAPGRVSLLPLRIGPPPFVTGAEDVAGDRQLIVNIKTVPGAGLRHYADGRRVIVDILEPEEPGSDSPVEEALAAAAESAAETLENGPDNALEAEDGPAVRADAVEAAPLDLTALAPLDETPLPPVPLRSSSDPETDGTVPVIAVQSREAGSAFHVNFPWPEPVGAAVFIRAGHIWILFDRPAVFDLGELAQEGAEFIGTPRPLDLEGAAGLRLALAENMLAAARPSQSGWRISIGPKSAATPRQIRVTAEDAARASRGLIFDLELPGRVLGIDDPTVGDRLIAVTGRAPAQGLLVPRRFVEFHALPTAQGLVIAPLTDDLEVTPLESAVRVSRPGGLTLSTVTTKVAGPLPLNDPRRTAAFMDYASWRSPSVERFEEKRRSLMVAAAAAPDEAQLAARLARARHFLAHDFAAEAMGVLRQITSDMPEAEDMAELRALRGVTALKLHRYETALEDLSAGKLVDDPNAALWRGLTLAALRRYAEARQAFGEGASAQAYYGPVEQTAFSLSEAKTALALNDFAAAQTALNQAPVEDGTFEQRQLAMLLRGQFHEAVGEYDRALALFDLVSTGGYPPTANRARLESALLSHRLGRITSEEALTQLGRVRYAWRGGPVEAEAMRAMGELYLAGGNYAEGLETLGLAVSYFPEYPYAAGLSDRRAEVFEDLFLNGGADEMEPVRALGLYYQFPELTPVGRKGDEMIRKLADRLIAVDLLNQAAELLDHQVENRLRGLGRSQVAADLALIYLMDRRPEDALTTLRTTRLAQLPAELVNERRLLEVQALTQLGQYDHALELLAETTGPETPLLRADVLWQAEAWSAAAAAIEELLGDAWRGDAPLDNAARSEVMRAAVAYSLAGDSEGLARLRGRYGPKMADSPDADGFQIVTEEIDRQGVAFRDLARRIAGTDRLQAFMDRLQSSRSGRGGTGEPSTALTP